MSIFLALQAALTPWGVVGLFSIIAFVAVYAIRKKFGPQWERLAAYIPALNFDLTPGATILSKVVQSLPGILIAAVLGAITSGGSVVPTLLAALGGALAAAGHEFAKWLPLIPYRGETGDVKIPAAPKLPTGIGLMLVIALMLGACSAATMKEPCSPADKAKIEAVYAEEALNCFNQDLAAEQACINEKMALRAKDEEKCR